MKNLLSHIKMGKEILRSEILKMKKNVLQP